MVARPVSGFSPSASTISGQRSRRSGCWRRSRPRACGGGAARNDERAVVGRGVQRDLLEASASSLQRVGEVREHRRVRLAREHRVEHALGQARSRLARARDLDLVVGVVE